MRDRQARMEDRMQRMQKDAPASIIDIAAVEPGSARSRVVHSQNAMDTLESFSSTMTPAWLRWWPTISASPASRSTTAGSLAELGRTRLAGGSYQDALVLDLMLPDADGLDLCRKLRGEQPDAADAAADADGARRGRWIASSASSSAPTTTCPSPSSCARELLARVKVSALLRRASPCNRTSTTTCCASAAFEIDPRRKRVAPPRRQVVRPDRPRQFADLLVVLAQSPRPGAVARPDHGRAEGPSARGLRPLDRRPHLAHPRRHRGRPEGAAPRPHRARRRLRVREEAGRRRRCCMSVAGPRPHAEAPSTGSPAAPVASRAT